MKKLLAIVLAALMVLSLGACGKKTEETNKKSSANKSEEYVGIDMHIACMTGPTGVGMAKLMNDAAEDKTANNYEFTVASAANDIMPKFIKGEIDIASVPTNVAASFYNSTNGKIRMLAVNTYGVLSILEKGDSIKDIKDLKGKTIYSTGKGQNPEYILKYILSENGIDPENDVTINFVSSDDLVAKLISGEAEVAMAPEPAATTVMIKNSALNRVLSINDEWAKVSDTELMMGCVIALDSYVEENPEAVEKFLEEYEKSIEFAIENTETASEYCETYKIAASKAIAQKAIPTCNLTYVTGDEMKDNVNGYFNVLYKADPEFIGGTLPKDDLYYKAD